MFIMKKIFIAAIIILFAAGVKAQIEMPRELTCTEEAFNFSFSWEQNGNSVYLKWGRLTL
jgi:hypothetical protein